MPVYAVGDNSFRIVTAPTAEAWLLAPVLVAEDGCSLVAANWSQAITCDSRGDLHSHGLPLPANAILPGSTRAWLGHDSFVATLDPDGHILDFAGGCSATSFSLVAVNGRGELLAVTETLSASPKVVLYVSLPSVLSPSPSSQPTALALPSAHTRILSIASGASHFLLLTTSGTVLAFGDNRFSQCGFSSLPSVDSLRELDFFSGLEPVEVACGAFHSAVRTRDGSLYVFGSDSEGQCGGEGEGGGTPKLVELAGDGADVEDEPEVTLVACGSFHTALVTDKGVYAAGLNHAGQLGLGDIEAQQTFTRSSSLSSLGNVTQLVCTRWSTFIEVDAPDAT